MKPTEIIKVKETEDTAGCDGGGGALGHPLVYLRFEGKPSVDCYYCSRRFAKPEYFTAQSQQPAAHA
ncbi:MAG: zinc-finger domain-containing protein [Gammaproteobacteria bacterium]|nr:zinc-finger domain-containing protein [Gammaproteobacteria bacterium]